MEEQTQDASLDNGLLGGVNEQDLVKPSNEEESTNVFEEPKQEAPKFERPEDLPSQFWDEENGTFKANDLFEEYKKEKEKALGLRKKLSSDRPQAVESVDSYQLNQELIADELGIEIQEDDLLLNAFKTEAFKNGLSQEQFENIYIGYMKEVLTNEDFQKGLPKEQSEEDQKLFIENEKKKLGDNADEQIQSVRNWMKQLYYDGVFSEEDLKTATNMGYNAGEIRVLNLMRQAAGHLSIPANTRPIDGMESEEEIQAIISDPTYWESPALQKKVTDYYERKTKK